MKINCLSDYKTFLKAKFMPGVRFTADGFAVVPDAARVDSDVAHKLTELAPHLHEYQRFAVAFAVAKKRAALFQECGLGKTSEALAWVEFVRSGEPAIICAPLAAIPEFFNERDKFYPQVNLQFVPSAQLDDWLDAPNGIAICSHHCFTRDRDLSNIKALVLDESSILKSGDGSIAMTIIRNSRGMKYKLALSATPAPNDPTEFATHSTFLEYMRSDAEFKARFFVRDGKDWRIKGHAVKELPQWLAGFSLWMTNPENYGMACNALPKEDYNLQYVFLDNGCKVEVERDIFNIPCSGMTMSKRSEIRADIYGCQGRLSTTLALIGHRQTIIWTIRNFHADLIEKALKKEGISCAQIAGATEEEERVNIIKAFRAGEIQVIISKPKVIGHGVNLQQAEQMIFAGYDESYEGMHQAIRRAHRQGRRGILDVFVLATPEETTVIETLKEKGKQWKTDSARQESLFADALRFDITAYREGKEMETTTDIKSREETTTNQYFTLVNDDCIDAMNHMEENSIDLTVFSPPFSSLFTYSSEKEDMGNCGDTGAEEFGIHFHYFADALYRVLKPGRVCCLHLAQLIAFRSRHGHKGLQDFRGRVIAKMEEAGFLYYGEFAIPKNPQAVAIRTKSERLQFSQLRRDSLESSPALNDYVLEFRKPGQQSVKVTPDITNEDWIKWASGVWSDINETDVLEESRSARGDADEKHICPLQLEVIRRCVRLWSNAGERVLTPFAGIGSEVYIAIEQGRYGVGVELKPEYFQQAVKNCNEAVTRFHKQAKLFQE